MGSKKSCKKSLNDGNQRRKTKFGGFFRNFRPEILANLKLTKQNSKFRKIPFPSLFCHQIHKILPKRSNLEFGISDDIFVQDWLLQWGYSLTRRIMGIEATVLQYCSTFLMQHQLYVMTRLMMTQ